jgi:hypothetical protein
MFFKGKVAELKRPMVREFITRCNQKTSFINTFPPSHGNYNKPQKAFQS